MDQIQVTGTLILEYSSVSSDSGNMFTYIRVLIRLIRFRKQVHIHQGIDPTHQIQVTGTNTLGYGSDSSIRVTGSLISEYGSRLIRFR